MHRKQRLLDEVLDFGGGGADPPGEVPTEVTAQDAEELPVRARIPLEAADHQRPEALFGLFLLQHWRIDSPAVREPHHSNAADSQSTNAEGSTAL
jgi:hypothetical protein